mgnify:CR=1 FL=1
MIYHTDGFEVRPLLSGEEVADLRAVITDQLDQMAHALLKPYAETAPDAGLEDRIEQIAQRDPSIAGLLGDAIATDAQHHPVARRIAENLTLRAAAQSVIGIPVTAQTFRFRYSSSALSRKRQGWHSDVARMDGGACSRTKCAIWIPLTDAGMQTGGLEIARGRWDAPLEHDAVPGAFVIPATALEKIEKMQPAVPAGHGLFIDRLTPHRALENKSGKTRWSFVVWMQE